MSLRDDFLPDVQALLEEFGVTATLTRSGAADAPTTAQKFNKAARTKPTAEQKPVRTVLSNQTSTNDQGKRLTQTIATMLEEPFEGDTLTVRDKTYKVGSVTVTAPQGEAIIYRAEVSL